MSVYKFPGKNTKEIMPIDPPGGGGDNVGMEARVIKLEDLAQETRERLARIEAKLDSTATKADMHDLKAELIKWMVGSAISLGVAGITVMTFVLNNAVPKTQSVQQAPIIINIPAQQPAPTQVK